MSAVIDRQPVPLTEPAALAAFVRGVERRALVLAELQCGDAATADAAVADALAAFRPAAAAAPLGDWPLLFWSRLLAQPALRGGVRPGAVALLQPLGAGPRAALLLRVAAGLDEADAARVLGLAPATYHLALHRALPPGADGAPDAAAWHALQGHAQQAARALPAARVARLSAPAVAAAPVPEDEGDAGVRPRVLTLLWALLALCVLAFGLTFWPPAARWLGAPHIRAQALGPAEPPASRFGAEAAVISHADFDQLADPAGDARSREADFDAWLATQTAAGAGLDGALAPLPPVEDAAPAEAAAPLPDSATPESHDAP